MATRPANRRAIVLDTAARLFADRGFNGVSVDELCATVGMTGPALYRHFKGKDAVLEAVLTSAARHVSAAVGSAPGHAATGDRTMLVEGAAQAVTAALLSRPHEVAVLLREGPHLVPERRGEVLADLREASAGWTDLLNRIHPGFPQEQVLSRAAALLGGVSEAARRSRGTDPARLEAVMIRSAAAMLLAPPWDEPPATPQEHDWSAPRSRYDVILEAALKRFRVVGFGGTTMEDIALEAGVSISALYRDYPTKGDILVDIYDRAGARTQAGLIDALANACDAAGALDGLLRSLAQIVIDAVELIVVTTRETAALPEEQLPRVARRNRAIRQGWSGVVAELRPDLEPDEAELLTRGVVALAMHTVNVDPLSRSRPGEIIALGRAFITGSAQV